MDRDDDPEDVTTEDEARPVAQSWLPPEAWSWPAAGAIETTTSPSQPVAPPPLPSFLQPAPGTATPEFLSFPQQSAAQPQPSSSSPEAQPGAEAELAAREDAERYAAECQAEAERVAAIQAGELAQKIQQSGLQLLHFIVSIDLPDIDDDEEDVSEGETYASDYKRAKAEREREEARLGELRTFDRSVTEHLSLCGLPHALKVKQQLQRWSVELNHVGDLNYLVALPVQASEWADLQDCEKATRKLIAIDHPRFTVSIDVVSDGDVLSLFAPAAMMRAGREAVGFSWAPTEGEELIGWLNRIAMRRSRLERLGKIAEIANGSAKIFAMMAPKDARLGSKPLEMKFLLSGHLFPLGVVSELFGSSGVGKTTLCTELCVAVATAEYGSSWLGRTIEAGNASGAVIYISGEDHPSHMYARQELLDPHGRAERFIDFCGDSRPLAEILKELSEVNVSLLVVDPALKYARGDENNQVAVSEFFAPLERFAVEKDAAVLVVHHTAKAAAPTSIASMKPRGAQAWIDRPRMILAAFRSGHLTKIGTTKNSAPPPSKGMPETAFRFDEETLRHVPAAAGVDDPAEREAVRVQGLVLALVGRLNAEGRLVRRTGDHGLFEARDVTLQGISRAAVWKAAAALLEEGTLSDGDGGLRVSSSVSTSPETAAGNPETTGSQIE